MKEVLILEDKEETRIVLTRLVKDVEPRAAVYAVAGEEEAYAIAMKKTIDLFIVDIILHPEITGDQSGADFAQDLRRIEKYLFTPILIVTSLYDPELCMYKAVQCYRFIEKPFDRDKVREIIRKALKYHTKNDEERKLIFHVDGLLQMITIKDIIYIETKNHRLYITTVKDQFCIPYRSCRGILKELDCDDFVMCSRSTIVNISYIEKIDPVNRFVYLKENERVLEIGTIMKKQFLEKIFEKTR